MSLSGVAGQVLSQDGLGSYLILAVHSLWKVSRLRLRCPMSHYRPRGARLDFREEASEFPTTQALSVKSLRKGAFLNIRYRD